MGFALLLLCAAFGAVVFVAPDGSDTNPGTVQQPFLTLEKARDTIRQLDDRQQASTVNIRGGTYYRTEPFTLDAQDYGVTYQAYNGESVVISGGVAIPGSAFTKHASIAGAYTVDLRQHGITSFGHMQGGSLGDCAHDMAELFFADAAMVLARWPNIADGDVWQWANAAEAGRTVNGRTSFTVNNDAAKRWMGEEDVWAHGYWQWDWFDTYIAIQNVSHSGLGVYNITLTNGQTVGKNARFYVTNALSELDVANEYFIDASGLLYFIPPKAPSTWESPAYVSVAEVIVQLNAATNVTFNGLQLLHARTSGIVGVQTSNVTITNCVVALHGADGISLTNSMHGTVAHNAVYQTGCIGVKVTGGNQATLTPAYNLVTHNEITDFALWKRTYKPGLYWGGVRNTYSYNNISYGPHNGILGGGNEVGAAFCVFEYNRLHTLCFETSDVGAFYTCGQAGQAWINRGNVLRFNTIENVRNTVKGPSVQGPDVHAIYLDDMMSGWQVLNNTIINSQSGVFIGGGRRNIVTGNTFQYTDTAMHLDNRGMNWEASQCKNENVKGLESVNYLHPPWSTTFPEVTTIEGDDPCVPKYNVFAHSRYCVGKFDDGTLSAANLAAWKSSAYDNTADC